MLSTSLAPLVPYVLQAIQRRRRPVINWSRPANDLTRLSTLYTACSSCGPPSAGRQAPRKIEHLRHHSSQLGGLPLQIRRYSCGRRRRPGACHRHSWRRILMRDYFLVEEATLSRTSGKDGESQGCKQSRVCPMAAI